MFVTDLWLLALQLILVWSIVESRDSKLIADGRAWRIDGREQALVGPGLATPLAVIWSKGGRDTIVVRVQFQADNTQLAHSTNANVLVMITQGGEQSRWLESGHKRGGICIM